MATIKKHSKWRICSSSKKEETDPEVLARRKKQIDYGKATEGYKNYTTAVPKESRTGGQPGTPKMRQRCSRRSWDGQIRLWRLLLHAYDSDKNYDTGNETGTETTNSSENSMMSMSLSEDAYD